MERGLHNVYTNAFDWAKLYFLFLCLLSPGGQHGHVQPFSDEDASIETLSHCSSFSDTTSVVDEGSSLVYTIFIQLHLLNMLQSLLEHVSMCAAYAVSGCVCVQSNCKVQFNKYFVSHQCCKGISDSCPTCCIARGRVERGRSPGGFPVQVEGIHRQHSG